MEALKAEMEARKRRTLELKERSGAAKRKFIRRGEIAAVEQKEIEEKREVISYIFTFVKTHSNKCMTGI